MIYTITNSPPCFDSKTNEKVALGVGVILLFIFLEDFSLASGVSWDLGRVDHFYI